jgi:hypothetical protein
MNFRMIRTAEGTTTQPLAVSLALALAALNLGLAVGAIVLQWLNGSYSTYEDPWADLLPAVAFSLMAALILSHRPNHIIGWLLMGISLFLVVEPFGLLYATYTILTRPGSLPGGQVALLFSLSGWGLAYGAIVWLILLFPNGYLLSRGWAWVGVIATGGMVAWTIFTGLATWNFGEALLLEDIPPGAETIRQWALGTIGLITLAFLAAVISLVLRLRRASGVERQQLKWFVYAAALVISVMLILILFEPYRDTPPFNIIGVILYALAFSAAPAAIGVAILR